MRRLGWQKALLGVKPVAEMLLVVLTCSCMAPVKPPPPPLSPSGFLTDYSQLRPSRTVDGAYSYVNPNKRLSHYKIIIIDPVEVRLRRESKAGSLGSADLAKLARYFEEELRAALRDSYPIVTQPGFGVLRIRAAITDVVPTATGANVLPGVIFGGIGLGGAAVELEFIDSLDNQRVGAFVDSARGETHRRWLGVLGEQGSAQDLLHQWALMLRDRLDEIQGLHRGGDFRSTGDLFR